MIVPSSSEKGVVAPANRPPAPEPPPIAMALPAAASPILAAAALPALALPPPEVAVSIPICPILVLPAQPPIKTIPTAPPRKFSPQLALGVAAVLALLGAAGLFAAQTRSAVPVDEEQPLAAVVPDGSQPEPTAQPISSPPADERPAARRLPDTPSHVVSLSSRRLDLPAPPPRIEKPEVRGGALRQGPPAQPAAAVPREAAERRQLIAEADLLRKLAGVTEVGVADKGLAVFNAHMAHSEMYLQLEAVPRQTDPTPVLQIRPGLKSMPFRHGRNSKLGTATANTLDALSRKLRIALTRLTPVGPDGKRPDPAVLYDTLRREMHGKKPEWLRPEAVPTLMQVLMPEDAPLRRMLVDLLAEIPGARATAALAKRAVFDLDADVRRAAVTALKERDGGHYRPVFLGAMRYPWAPAADHAAEALVTLGDRHAVPELISLLKKPDPSLPVTYNGRHTVVQELVRTNHFTNCLLCHPPALTGKEPVVGIDPSVAIPFTLVTTSTTPQIPQGVAPGGRGRGPAGQLPARPRPGAVPLAQRQPKPPQGQLQAQPPGAAGIQQQAQNALQQVQGVGNLPQGFLQRLQVTAQRVSNQAGCHDYGAAAAALSVNTSKAGGQGAAGAQAAGGAGANPAAPPPPAPAAQPRPRGVPVAQRRPGGLPVVGPGRRNVPFAVGGRSVPFLQPAIGLLPAAATALQPTFSVTSGAIPVLVRGDITYLRQDFSAQLPVPRGFLVRPLSVRFDYMVRTRIVSKAEAARIRTKLGDRDTYPQREAVLSALRQLTGQDAGSTTQAWLERFPRAEQDLEATRLSGQLVRSTGMPRDLLLQKLRDARGVVNTVALATAIPSLSGPFKEKARQALADRLARMTSATLQDKFHDEEPEVRRAAVEASLRKDKQELVPDLIALLSDPEPLTARAAEAALRDLTGADCTTPDAWKQWWQKQ